MDKKHCLSVCLYLCMYVSMYVCYVLSIWLTMLSVWPDKEQHRSLKGKSLSLNNRLKKDAIALWSLIIAMKELYPYNNFIFIQDSAPFHRAKIVKSFSRKELKSRFAANTQWPPSSPGCNPLDYYFWNEVKEKFIVATMLNLSRVKKSLKTRFSLRGTNIL